MLSPRGAVRMLRALRLAFALAVLAGLAAFAAPAQAEEAINLYRSDVSVARDGTLTVAETIRVHAEGNLIKRGIYRDFPLTFADAGGTVREVGFKLLSVTRDGRPEPHFTESHGDSVRIYAGAQDVMLTPGADYTYVFTYETDRQVRWFDGKPELYWNVTGNAWAFPIESASVRLTLPGGAAPVRWTAYTGPVGARGTAWRGAITDGVLAVETTQALGPGEGLTIVAEIPADAVSQPTGADAARYFLRDYRGWIIGIVGLVLVLGYYLVTWNAVGRDPPAGTVIPLFHPPEGISAALAGYIRNWGFGANAQRDFTAAALSLAVKGLVVFDQTKKGELTLERTERAVPQGPNGIMLPAGEAEILRWVELEGGIAHVNQAHAQSVAKMLQGFTKAIEAENRGKFFRRNTLYFVGGLALTVLVFLAVLFFGGLYGRELALLFPVLFVGMVFGFIAIPIVRTIASGPSAGGIVKAGMSLVIAILFIASFAGSFLMRAAGEPYGLLYAATHFIRQHPLPIALVLVFPALNGLFLYLLRAPTALGRPVMDKIAGFRLYLETAESGRLNMARAPEITTERFEALLPYAVALGVERPWSDAFAAALARAHPSEPDPIGLYRPGWSRGGTWSGADFGRSIGSTVSAATGALAASMPRASSGSSGFGGGGGSGGGGGGGGGGGW